MYRQMYRYVRGQIEARIYAVGGELPTPEQLNHQFGVSSPTFARQAYSELMAEGLVQFHDGRYVVAAVTPPAVQTVTDAVDRLDALEASLNETLVALRRLRGEIAGVQTPQVGQWWRVRSLARGADPVETSHAVCVRDRESNELQWLAAISNTWVRKPLHYFEPIQRTAYIADWGRDDRGGTQKGSPPPPPPPTTGGGTPAIAAGVAYYASAEQRDAHANFEGYGPEQWSEGFFTG